MSPFVLCTGGKLSVMGEEDLLATPRYLSTWTNLVLGHAVTAASASNKLHMTTKQSAITIAQVEYRISTGWMTTLISTFTSCPDSGLHVSEWSVAIVGKSTAELYNPNQTKYATRMG